jgi:hypothetical protein
MAIDPQIANAGWNPFQAGQQLAQQRSSSRLQQLYLGQQMEHAQSAEARAQSQEHRAQQAFGMQQENFTREQTEAEARRMLGVFNDFLGPWAQGALAAGDEAAQRKYVADSLRNPAFRQRLQQADLYDNIDDIDPNDPDLLGELQMLAGAVKPAGSTGVHSAYQAEDGSLVYLNRDGKVVKTDTRIQKFAPQIVGKAGGLEWADPNTQETTTGGAVATPQEQIGAEAWKAAAVERAKQNEQIAAIPRRASAERDAQAPQRAEKLRLTLNNIDNVIGKANDALGSTSLWTTGLIGAMTDAVPGSAAYDLRTTLGTIRANLGFDRLQAMRDASPTGGALGQVAVQELEALQSALASLDQAQSPEALKRSLRAVITHYDNWRDAVIEANRDVAPQSATAGGRQQPAGQSGGQSGGGVIDFGSMQ